MAETLVKTNPSFIENTQNFRSSCSQILSKKVFLKISQNSQENTKGLPESLQLYSKLTPAQVFSCEFSKIFKNIYFLIYFQVAASEI